MSLPGWCEYELLPWQKEIVKIASNSYTPTEYNEFARHCMWRRIFGYVPTKGEKKAYATSLGSKIYEIKPAEEDYKTAEVKLKELMEERAKHPHLTINPFEQEKCLTITFESLGPYKGYGSDERDYIFFDDFGENTIPNHLYRSEETLKQMKDDLMDCLVDIGTSASTVVDWSVGQPITCTTTASSYPVAKPCAPEGYAKAAKPSKKENNMGYEISTAFIENDQRRHLKSRLQNVRWTKDTELTGKFHMGNAKIKDKDDLIAAMKDGRLQIRGEAFNEDGKLHNYYSYMNTLVFRDKDRDEEGYKSASAALDKAFVEAADKITILSPKEGLDVLNTFEAQTF